jgi:hypothetical protein
MCEATVTGVHTFHMSPVSTPCDIKPVRGGVPPTLNPPSSRFPDRGSHCENINAPYGVPPRVCVRQLSAVSAPLICRRCPHRATLNPSFSWSPDRERYRKSTLRRGHHGYIVFLLWQEISANVFIPCRIPHKALISFAYGEMLIGKHSFQIGRHTPVVLTTGAWHPCHALHLTPFAEASRRR